MAVSVFYGTDRKRTGNSQPADYYGPLRGEPELGICEVSIPQQHALGKLESPYLWQSENPLKHVVLLSLQALTQEHWSSEIASRVNASANKDAFVFVHGYNVSFEDACRRTAQIAYDLKFTGAPLMWSWPANGKTLDYVKDLNDAEWSAANLRTFLLSVARTSKAQRIHVVAHSMGARVVTRALADLQSSQLHTGRKPLFNHIVLAAPDIDRDVFIRLASIVRQTSEGITLYASSRDRALQYSNSVHGGPRAGEAGPNIVLIDGVDTIDASLVDTSFLGHSYYGDRVSVIADMFELLQLRHPPGRRFHLKELLHIGRIYWQFRSQ